MGRAKSKRKHSETPCFHPSSVIATQAGCKLFRYKLTSMKAVGRALWPISLNGHMKIKIKLKIIFTLQYRRYKDNFSHLEKQALNM
jgi:hypothetical protein